MTLLVIPDDYQKATDGLDFLHAHSGFTVRALGDLSRDPTADPLLSEAQGLILIRERTRIDRRFLQKTPRLKLISQTSKVARHIDLQACTDAGVAVVEGFGSAVAPAELTWLLIMAARRQLVVAVNAMKQGLWQVNIGEALAGQTLGILGFGNIGKRMAHFAQAFDMKVLIWGTARAQQEARSLGLRVAENREAFFAEADIITVHQRLVAENTGNITLADLSLMKSSALFVNTSRAELVAPDALEQALRQGRPGFAALDVFMHEPVYDKNAPLLQMPNVLCTPHLGYVEKAGYELYFKTAFENAVRFFQGDTSGVLNPEALKK